MIIEVEVHKAKPFFPKTLVAFLQVIRSKRSPCKIIVKNDQHVMLKCLYGC